jgi:hypothetical protein
METINKKILVFLFLPIFIFGFLNYHSKFIYADFEGTVDPGTYEGDDDSENSSTFDETESQGTFEGTVDPGTYEGDTSDSTTYDGTSEEGIYDESLTEGYFEGLIEDFYYQYTLDDGDYIETTNTGEYNQEGPEISNIEVNPSPTNQGSVSIIINFNENEILNLENHPTVQVTGLNTTYNVTEENYSGTTWEGSFILLDEDEETTANISVSGAEDIAGNIRNDPNAGFFEVDTLGPQVSSIIVPEIVGPGEVNITLEFNESLSVRPTVQVTGLNTTYNVTEENYSGTTWEGSFILLDEDEETTANISVSGAEDILGNQMMNQTLSGEFTADSISPNNPTLNPVQTPTIANNQTISGAKDANTSIWLNGSEIISLNSNTNWSYDLPLNIGTNNLRIMARDEALNSSEIIESSIIREDDGGGGGGGGGSYHTYDNTAPDINYVEIEEGYNSATISWETDESSISWLVYGETDNYGEEIKIIDYEREHSITLENLTPNTTYHFQIKSEDRDNNIGTSNDFQFTTLGSDNMEEQIEVGGGSTVLFSKMMNDWEKTGDSDADLNNDNIVNLYDFSILMANWK